MKDTGLYALVIAFFILSAPIRWFFSIIGIAVAVIGFQLVFGVVGLVLCVVFFVLFLSLPGIFAYFKWDERGGPAETWVRTFMKRDGMTRSEAIARVRWEYESRGVPVTPEVEKLK